MSQLSLEAPLSQFARRVRWGTIAAAALPLSCACVFAVTPLRSPFACPILALTGVPCPSCGMTRSVVSLVRGQVGEAIAYHAFGPVVCLGLLTIIWHCVWELRVGRRVMTPYVRWASQWRWQKWGVASFLGYYGLRLLMWRWM
ncbi:MAG: DUF2752 domain-containing protein [Cyanobacteria bacterium J06639_1]